MTTRSKYGVRRVRAKWQPMRRASFTTSVLPAEPGEMSADRVSAVFFVVNGVLPSMKNQRRQLKNRRTGKMFSAKSEAAVNYKAEFPFLVPRSAKIGMGSETQFLRLNVNVFYPDWTHDVDIELLCDCLQFAGVVSNDRWIREKHVYGAQIDPKNPRVEIQLEEI